MLCRLKAALTLHVRFMNPDQKVVHVRNLKAELVLCCAVLTRSCMVDASNAEQATSAGPTHENLGWEAGL